MDLSLIIPVYNTRNWLIECLDSAKAAIDGIDAEVLLIDDGSTDDSGLIAKEYAEKNPSFHYYHKENGGLSAARNYGISLAKGKYLAFLDSDDKVADWIYRDMLYMAEKNQTPLTICNVTRLNDKGATPVSAQYQTVFSAPPAAVTSLRENLNLVYNTAVWNKLILRSFWDEHKLSFPEGRIYEDGPVSLRLHWYAGRISVLYGFGYYYRIREGSLISITQQTSSLKNLQDILDMEKDMLDFIHERMDEPGAQEILIAQQKKILSLPLEGIFNSLYKMDKSSQEIFINKIGDFMKEAISAEALEELSLFQKLKYRLLVSHDPDGLIQLLNHRRLAWNNMPVIELGGIPMMVLPEEIYKKSMTPAAKEMQNIIPITRIDSVSSEAGSVVINMTVHYPRINSPIGCDRRIKAFIYCEYTGEKIFFKTEAIPSPELTAEKGTTICYDDFRIYEYNYDGAGIRVLIPLDTLMALDTTGKWYLGIAFDTSIAKGERLIRSISPDAKKYMLEKLKDINPDHLGAGNSITAKFDQRESFFFVMS